MYFDTDAEYAHCSATVTVPDGKEGVECVFVAGNASPPGVTSGRFELAFYDKNDVKLNSMEVLVKDKDEFYRYTSAGTGGAVVIPDNTEYIKFSVEAHKGRSSMKLYFKDLSFTFYDEAEDIVGGEPIGVFVSEKVDDKPIRINEEANWFTVILMIGALITGIAAIAGIKTAKRKNKLSKSDPDSNKS